MQTQRRVNHAFTLIELLVVVAIIAVLIALLVPAMGEAKRVAKTAACASNLKGIDEVMREYATENNDAILGNAWTSAAFLNGIDPKTNLAYSETDCPYVCSVFDWMSPTLIESGLLPTTLQGSTEGSPTSTVTNTRYNRFVLECNYKLFTCPENEAVMTAYSAGDQFGTLPAFSYVTSLAFQTAYAKGSTTDTTQSYIVSTYTPKLTLVGSEQTKVFIADGTRYDTADSNLPPDYELKVLGDSSPGDPYADWGPWDSINSRTYQANTLPTSTTSPMMYSMRHGTQSSTAAVASYKFNLGFFDGHAETMNGVDGGAPNLWLPSGATFTVSSECNAATQTLYNLPSGTFMAN